MSTKAKKTSMESQALKQAVSQAVKTTSYQLKGNWESKPTDSKSSGSKTVIAIKK